ncbi:ABC transporter substrate-binding protein [Micromonospora sp. WMMD961]|uniref:ABC transporter substrate-binding protein n=1 Tax=Micromonospora sp. WMMD961 TaxID=3016100 RepID=UPI002416EC52|nr:ABC transporter substrate-binding protein [Micromonospora sp. WMMD961]MDG4782365.1 ABC transporter substrate-binding protein [Micromonospora sp. WMMD961]
MRIVSLLPAATDIVAMLGLTGYLVGRTHECDWPPGDLAGVPVVTGTSLPEALTSREISAAIAGDAHRGSSLYQLDVTTLEDLKPDLILTQDLCDVCAVSYARVNDAVRLIDLDTRVVSLEARTIGGILDTVGAVAALTGTTGRAAEIRADAERRLGALPGALPGAPTVLFVEWLDPLMPGGHWVPEQITLGGGRPLLLGPGAHSTPHQWSVVADLAPDVVVFGPCGFTPERTIDELSVAAGQPGWVDLPAVRRGQVWVVDGPAYFNRPGPRVVDGAEILAAILAGRPDSRARQVSAGVG